MEFEIGKLYKSKFNGLIIECVGGKPLDEDCFCGEVVIEHENYDMNEVSNSFVKKSFAPYEAPIPLKNGGKYSIPKGCKATIQDDVVIIKEDVGYSKVEEEGVIKWTRTGINAMQITCWNGLYEISMMNIGIGNEPSTKEEFEEAYQNALGALKLK